MEERSSRYIPATPEEIAQMLEVVGQPSMEALIESLVPPGDRDAEPLDLPRGLTEPEVVARLRDLAAANPSISPSRVFLGGGAYGHHIPSVIPHLASRGEYLTAYTPYQPEVSQGTLQAMYEFQSLTCELLGMEVANASNYEAASAVAEAVNMARRVGRRKRTRALLAGAIHPEYAATCCTYGHSGVVSLESIPPTEAGRVDIELLSRSLGADVCAVVVQSPNFFGLLEDLSELARITHEAGALLVVAVADPHACALFEAPGAQGADIVVGEGQPLGLPLSLGGPYLGLFATHARHIRQMPGRLVGRTRDAEGEEGFVLTLATREQHIRRARATSNICTNQGLCALMVSMYLSLLGPEGLRQVAWQSHARALHLKRAIAQLPGFDVPHEGPFFHEFLVRTPVPAAELVDRLYQHGFFAGVPLARYWPQRDHELLVCATERNRRIDLDTLVELLDKEARR